MKTTNTCSNNNLNYFNNASTHNTNIELKINHVNNNVLIYKNNKVITEIKNTNINNLIGPKLDLILELISN